MLDIWHQDLECDFATPPWDRQETSFFSFPWLRGSKRRDEGRDDDRSPANENVQRSLSLTTDLRDNDVIHGGERKLLEVIEAGLEAAENMQAVVIHSTCVPTVIGDDVSKVIRVVEGRSPVPVIHTNPAANQGVDVGRSMLERLRAEEGYARQEKIPGSINLVGFPEGPGMAEIADLLESAGVRINARVMPSLSPAQARRLPRAEAQIFLPNAAYEPIYDQIFRTLPVAGRGRALRPRG